MATQKWLLLNYLLGVPAAGSAGATYNQDYGSNAWGNYWTPSTDLTNLLATLDVFGIFAYTVSSNPNSWASNLLPQIVSAGKKINVVNLGGITSTSGSTNGANTAASDLTYLNAVIAKGGTVDYITVDGFPLFLFQSGTYTQSDANTQLLSYMQTIHAAPGMSGVKIGLDVNFPLWGWQGQVNSSGIVPNSPSAGLADYSAVLTSMVNYINANGERLWFNLIDNGGETVLNFAAGVDWYARTIQLQQQCQSLGLLCGPYLQTDRQGVDDSQWYDDILRYQQGYLARGGNPDITCAAAWTAVPTHLFPATQTHTFANLWNRILNGPLPAVQGAYVAGRRAPRFSLSFYQPLTGNALGARIGGYTLDRDVESCSISTNSNGGFDGMTAGFDKIVTFQNETTPRRFSRLHIPIQIQGFAHVVLTEGNRPVWEGRIMLPEVEGGVLKSFQAQGYGMSGTKDGVWQSADTALSMTSGNVLAWLMRSQAPILVPDSPMRYIDPAVPHSPGEFNLMTPADAISKVVKEGDQYANALMLCVYDGRRVQLLPQLPPTRPDYVVDWSDVTSYQPNYEGVYSDLVLEYTGGTQSPMTFSNPQYNSNYPRRTAHISGGTMTDAAALAYGQNWITTAAKAATSITITVGGLVYGAVEGLRVPGGGSRAPWMVRSGQWVQVADDYMLPIVKTTCDLNTLQLQVQCGAPALNWTNLIADLRNNSRYFLLQTSPATGSRI